MPLLLMFFALAVGIWGLVLCRYGGRKLRLFHPVPLIALGVILTGSVVSGDFWALRAGPIPITIDRLLIGILVVVFFFRYMLQLEDRRQVNRMDVVLIWLMGVLMISTLTHDITLLDNMPISRLLFFNLMPLVLYGVIRSGVLGTNDLKLISVAMVGLSVYLALTALAETKGFTSLVFPRYIMTSEVREFLGRGRGPFLNPVSNGLFMIVGFCCTLMWWRSADRFGKLGVIAIAGLIGIGVYSTLTRSVWLALIVACGWFIWMPATRRVKSLMVVGGLLAGIALMPVLGEKIFSFKRDAEVTQTQMEKSAQMRPLFAIVAMNMFEDRPFLGCGFGQYTRAKKPYLQDPHSGKPLAMTKSLMQHNIFLAYLTETGLLGLLSLLLAMAMMARSGLVIWLSQDLPFWPRQFGLLLLTLLSCYAVNGMFHDVSIVPMANMLLFFLAGIVNNLISGQWQFDREAIVVSQRVVGHSQSSLA